MQSTRSIAAARAGNGRRRNGRGRWLRLTVAAAVPALLALAGCGGGASAGSSNGTFSVSPGTVAIDTNCTGCNTSNSSGQAVEQFTATPSGGGTASVTWSVSGGDASSGAGSITTGGVYTPPSYLTADSVQVTVTAKLTSNPSVAASSTLTVTPGFLQPLTPENLALGANGTATITGYLAEVGGTRNISYALANTATGSSGGLGSLGAANCTHNENAFTTCTVTYTAPSTVSSTSATYVVASVGTVSKTGAEVLLNAAGVNSNPATHQTQFGANIPLGSSGSNNNDYDTNSSGRVIDCCGGTLGALIQDNGGHPYLLSNNHVLARSDQASVGEHIVQPGLIDDNCTPYGQVGAATTLVGNLTTWVPLKSGTTNVDAAIAQVNAGAVNASGNILELGTKQADGTLAAAPPGVSSSGGKGESAALNMVVAKSGRTTGLTCAKISTISLDVEVSYYSDCAETKPYYTKTYTNQIGIEGNQFSDAGDSGSLVVDQGNAEPVGLFFAGGQAGNVSEGVANPVSDVLSELAAQTGNGVTYSFVGTTDHPVSCLNYGNATATAAQVRTLSATEMERTQRALMQARMLINPSTGILGVALGRSSDRIGEGAVIVYVQPGARVNTPATIDGERTIVIPASAQAVAQGTAPQSALEAQPAALTAGVLGQAVAIKQQIALSLMKKEPAFFGVGVGQSLDDPRQAALVIYVDRHQVPAQLPATIDGLRTRYVIMDRFHVTRSYARGTPSHSRCSARSAAAHPQPFTGFGLFRPHAIHLF